MSVDWEELIPHIAHDIRALARKSIINAQLLEKLLCSTGNSESLGHLRAIVASQLDLNSFLGRLVVLADAGSASTETVDLETAILGAKLECRDAIQRLGAEIAIHPVPHCSVPRRTQVVLKELIDNSLRYRDPARALRIAINADADTDIIRVGVKDNGTGLPSKYADKLFEPLERLDAARSGFGLGLAISRAIVEVGGGRIYAEPSACGAAVVFELPHHGP